MNWIQKANDWIQKADDRIVETVQEVYRWLWNWTGVYVGTLVFLACVGDRVFWGPLDWFDFVWLGMMGITAAIRYLAQSKDLRQLNHIQRVWRDLYGRAFLSVAMVGFVAGAAIQGNWWHMASNVCGLAWLYISCVQVHDRDPKELFPSLKPVGAQT